jgi:hypothetical protein
VAEARPGGGGRQLERAGRKSQILEAYLNAVPFRGEVVGVNALAQTLFGKHPSGLDAQEAASPPRWCAAPTPAPGRWPSAPAACCSAMQLPCDGVPRWPRRRCSAGAACRWAKQLAPHFARLALRRDGPAVQRSTLDAGLQRVAVQALRQQLAELQGRNVEDGAVVVLDNASGEVLAWVGRATASSARRRSTACWRGASRARRSSPSSTAGLRTAADHAGQPARRFAGRDPHRRRPVPAAELRPPASAGRSACAPRSAPA